MRFLRKTCLFVCGVLLCGVCFSSCSSTAEKNPSPSVGTNGTATGQRVTVLVDVNGLTEYDLRATINDTDKANIASYDQSALRWTLTAKFVKNVEAVTAENGIVQTSDIEKRLYTLIIKKGSEGIYKADVDFFDSDGELIWNEVSKIGDVMLYKYSTPVDGVSIVENPHGKTGKYFKVTRPASAEVEFTLLPLHSKEYYQKIGNGYTLSFEWFLVLDGHLEPIGETIPTTAGYKTNDGCNFPMPSLDWQKTSLPLATLLMYYDELTTRPAGSSFRTRTMIAINDNSNKMSIEWYLGNFQLVNEEA